MPSRVIARVNIMSIRTFLLGGMTAAFAVAGFAVGTYQPQAVEPTSLVLKKPDFEKVPRSRLGVVIAANAGRLKLTPDQVRRVQAVVGPALRKEIATSKSLWDRRVRTEEKIASGEWLPQTVDHDFFFTGNDQPGAAYGRTVYPWFGVSYEFELTPKVKAIIGKTTIDQAISIAHKIAQEDGARAFEFAMLPETQAKLNLSPLQKKQFGLLDRRVDMYFSKRRQTKPGSMADTFLRAIAMQMIFGLLEPKQNLMLESLLWDEICIRP